MPGSVKRNGAGIPTDIRWGSLSLTTKRGEETSAHVTPDQAEAFFNRNGPKGGVVSWIPSNGKRL
jgi:hypothetical protein